MACSWEVQGSRAMSIHMAAQAAHERNLGAVALRNCVVQMIATMVCVHIGNTHTYRIDSAMLCARIDLTACLCTRPVACGGDGRAACRPLCNRYGTERGGATPLLTNPGARRQRFRASSSHARPCVVGGSERGACERLSHRGLLQRCVAGHLRPVPLHGTINFFIPELRGS